MTPKEYGEVRIPPEETLPESGTITSARTNALWLGDVYYIRVWVLQFDDGSKYVLRIPRRGSRERWNEDDAFELRSQVLTMKLI